MSKDYLEELERLTEYFEPVEDENNANPSKAMKCAEKIEGFMKYHELYDTYKNELTIIKQYILKAQDLEKENVELKAKAQGQEKLLNTIFQNIKLDENYSEQCGGSTKAYKLVIPNCISVEEDENYTDDSFPNSDFEVIDNFMKERIENE